MAWTIIKLKALVLTPLHIHIHTARCFLPLCFKIDETPVSANCRDFLKTLCCSEGLAVQSSYKHIDVLL